MLKWIIAILVLPIALLNYLLQVGAYLIHTFLDGVSAGVGMAFDWVDKLPFPKGEF